MEEGQEYSHSHLCIHLDREKWESAYHVRGLGRYGSIIDCSGCVIQFAAAFMGIFGASY